MHVAMAHDICEVVPRIRASAARRRALTELQSKYDLSFLTFPETPPLLEPPQTPPPTPPQPKRKRKRAAKADAKEAPSAAGGDVSQGADADARTAAGEDAAHQLARGRAKRKRRR